MKMRINKYLAIGGVGARRKVDELIRLKKVTVNGEIAKLGMIIDPNKDVVEVMGKKVRGKANFEYVMVNKPKGVVSTVSDESGRQTVVDLVKLPARLYPVGRLDIDSQGLIILTDDGELAYKLTHPKFEIEKEYEVRTGGRITDRVLECLREGVVILGRRTSKAEVEVISQEGDRAKLKIKIHEGRNRQVRRMCAAVGLEVEALRRVAIGGVRLGDLKVGEWRRLTEGEVRNLKTANNQ